jgi:hypothetical protein
VITISTGTEPTNKLWYMEVAALPVSSATGGMDLSAYDLQKGTAAKPRPIWTLNTNLNASRNQCGAHRVPVLPDPVLFNGSAG